jgi:transcription initiation factor TFIID subunit 5
VFLPACLPACLQISSMAFSPDGTTLATADASGAVVAWDLATSRRLASASEHRGPVWSLAYSQGEGALLASGGADHCVRLWDAKGAPAGGAAAAAAGGAQQRRGAAAVQQRQGAAAVGSNEPYGLLATWRTKMTPVFGLRFTSRNLLLGSGALTLPQRAPPRG